MLNKTKNCIIDNKSQRGGGGGRVGGDGETKEFQTIDVMVERVVALVVVSSVSSKRLRFAALLSSPLQLICFSHYIYASAFQSIYTNQ